MQSSRMDLSVPKSTSLSMALPLGWVWIHLTPESLSSLRTTRMSGMATVFASPTLTSTIAPLRLMYTEISRLMAAVHALKCSKSSVVANVSCPTSNS